jgi:hypothetical protein
VGKFVTGRAVFCVIPACSTCLAVRSIQIPDSGARNRHDAGGDQASLRVPLLCLRDRRQYNDQGRAVKKPQCQVSIISPCARRSRWLKYWSWLGSRPSNVGGTSCGGLVRSTGHRRPRVAVFRQISARTRIGASNVGPPGTNSIFGPRSRNWTCTEPPSLSASDSIWRFLRSAAHRNRDRARLHHEQRRGTRNRIHNRYTTD